MKKTSSKDQRVHYRIVSVVLMITMILTCVLLTGCGRNSSKGLTEYWTKDSAAAQSLTDYVSKVTNEKDTENYIPVKDRIAVFDMDGTLTCETYYTYYDTMMFINYCLKDHPERVSDELKEAAAEIRPGYTAGEELARNFAKAYAGMTVDEFLNYVLKFREEAAPGYDGMTRGDSFYQPMVEVVDYLQDNGFTVYVVSGTDRIISRGIVKDNLNIPMSQVIGSDETIVASGQGGEDGLEYQLQKDDKIITGGQFVVKDLKMNKVSVIAQEIGEQPVLAFGNSTGTPVCVIM